MWKNVQQFIDMESGQALIQKVAHDEESKHEDVVERLGEFPG